MARRQERVDSVPLAPYTVDNVTAHPTGRTVTGDDGDKKSGEKAPESRVSWDAVALDPEDITPEPRAET